MKMRAVALCAAAMLMSAGLLVVPAGASAASELGAAVKMPLVHNPGNNCQLGADALPGTGTPTDSFALIRSDGWGVDALVVLVNGLPNVTYTVYLIQSQGDPASDPMDCFVVDATLTTNSAGVGTVRISESLLSGATYVHVYLYTIVPDREFDYFDTGLVRVR